VLLNEFPTHKSDTLATAKLFQLLHLVVMEEAAPFPRPVNADLSAFCGLLDNRVGMRYDLLCLREVPGRDIGYFCNLGPHIYFLSFRQI
jgi:hypothetical protein